MQKTTELTGYFSVVVPNHTAIMLRTWMEERLLGTVIPYRNHY